MATYADLQNEVLRHQLSDTKYRPFVKEWLNEGLRYIALQADVRTAQAEATYETEVDEPTLDLPDDFARLVSLRNTTDRDPLTRIDLRDYDDAPSSTGTPVGYVVIGSQINLYPTPDSAYDLSLRYWKMPAVMDESNGEVGLPEAYHHLLVRYCLIRAFQVENDYEAANYWRQEFNDELMRLRSQAQYDTFDGPIITPGTWGEGYDEWRL